MRFKFYCDDTIIGILSLSETTPESMARQAIKEVDKALGSNKLCVDNAYPN